MSLSLAEWVRCGRLEDVLTGPMGGVTPCDPPPPEMRPRPMSEDPPVRRGMMMTMMTFVMMGSITIITVMMMMIIAMVNHRSKLRTRPNQNVAPQHAASQSQHTCSCNLCHDTASFVAPPAAPGSLAGPGRHDGERLPGIRKSLPNDSIPSPT
jgi:hypothetical protein